MTFSRLKNPRAWLQFIQCAGAEYYLQQNQVLKTVTLEQTTICHCRPLFEGHMVGSWPMKRDIKIMIIIISNSNWIEWSRNQGVIARVISKSDAREARGRV